MRTIKTVSIAEVDEIGEVAALKAEAARRIPEIGEGPRHFAVSDVVRMSTGRRSAQKGGLAVVIAERDNDGEYLAVYLNDAGFFALTRFTRNQADPYEPADPA